MLDLRARIIGIGIIGSAIIAVIVGVGSWLLRRSQPTPVYTPPTASSPPSSTVTTNVPAGGLGTVTGKQPTDIPSSGIAPSDGAPTPSAPGLDRTQRVERGSAEELLSIAYSFAGIYGSFSNAGGFENLERLRFLMSRRMNAWADQLIAQKKPVAGSTDLYYGMTTTTLSAQLKQQDSNRSVVLVQTQRKETRGVLSNARYLLEDLTITFVREEGLWKVDSAIWSNQRILGGTPSVPESHAQRGATSSSGSAR